jgi:hypothetical protein
MNYSENLIKALASGNIEQIIIAKDDAVRKAKVYTSADEFLKDIYRSVMSDNESDPFPEYRLELSPEEEAKLLPLLKTLESLD